MAYPCFKLTKSKNDKFYFNLHAKNGQIIGTSEMYEAKASAENGIRSVKENAPLDGRYDLEQNGDKYHFNLKAGNSQVILSSEVYNSKASAENGMRSVKENAPISEIMDETA